MLIFFKQNNGFGIRHKCIPLKMRHLALYPKIKRLSQVYSIPFLKTISET